MTRLIQCFIVITLLAGSVAAQADTTFVYQGVLAESGEPADGSYNMDFALWDALSGGNQVGTTIQFNDHPVSDGLFTVELDFGADVFDGSQLWLEIAVNGNELAPRQPITGAPYSIQTRGIFVNGAGNVGIGTTSPVWEFEVANLTPGDGAESGVTADDAGGALAAYSSTLPPPFDHFAGRVSVLSNAITMGLDLRADSAVGDVRFYTGGPWLLNERMRITSIGSVGIGTANADDGRLVVVDDYDRNVIDIQSTSLSGWAAIDFIDSDGDTVGFVGYGNPSVFNYPDRVFLGAVDRDIVLDPGTGNVGIGTNDPNRKLDVIGDARFSGSVRIEATENEYAVWVTTNNGGGIRVAANADQDTAVFGGVSGMQSAGVYGLAESTGTVNYGVYGNSNSTSGYDFYAGGNGQDYGSSSSIRWKSNVRNIDQPLERIRQLRGVYFDWDAEHGGHHDVGMIAEEVGAVLPEIVTYEANGVDADGMDYSKLAPLLVEAVNALRAEKDAEIDALRAEFEAEIRELAQRISDLEHLLEQLTVEETE